MEPDRRAPPAQVPAGSLGAGKSGNTFVAWGNIVLSVYRHPLASSQQAVVLLLYLLSALSLAAAIVWLSTQPWPMGGDFNVAIAEFREILPDSSRARTGTSAWVGQSLLDFLDGEYKRAGFGLEVQVDNRHMGDVTNLIEAEALARRVGADLVVFGTLTSQDGQVTFRPSFYVVPEVERYRGGTALIKRDVDELLGAHDFSVTLTDDVETTLESRAAVLASFAQGLVHLHNDRDRLARVAFEDAIDEAAALDDFQGSQVLYLFAAVASYKLEDFETALDHLDAAEALDANYGRAQVARGNIYFIQAQAGCGSSGLDEIATAYCDADDQAAVRDYLLYRAREIYNGVAQDCEQPYGAHLCEKAWLNMGHIDLQLAQEDTPALYERAANDYQQAASIAQELAGDDARDLAARAYRGLGQARQRQGLLEEAIDAYGRCERLAVYDTATADECRASRDQAQAWQKGP
jgi:tetratricopeptide (TPR) repeat protein